MTKLVIGGAGGAPSENVIKSLKEGMDAEIIGIGSEITDLMLSYAERKYLVPYAVKKGYKERLFQIIKEEGPELLHFQNDIEIREISRMRDDILATGTKLFMPSKQTVEICVDKAKSAEIWEKEGVKIPKTMLISEEEDLKRAFSQLANRDGAIWLRATEGGGGKGALPIDNYDFAKHWIDRYRGWGAFTAAQLLTPQTVTWLSLWHEGELVVAQTRLRRSWNFGNRTLSGVTGITGVGETFSDPTVNKVALDAIHSIDKRPHGIFGVDMAYDFEGYPNPTEINISRFFTTVYFFTKAGLNMPAVYANIALGKEITTFDKKINPLPDGLLWIRGMDREPILTTEAEMKQTIRVG